MIRRAACAPTDWKNNILLALTTGTAVILLGCGGGGGGGNGGPPSSGACGGAALCGQVASADASGGLVAGATVTLTDNNGNPLGSTTTDANGQYSFATLPAGATLFRVDPPATTYHQNIISFNGGLYGLNYKNQAQNGPCLPAINQPAGGTDNQLTVVRVYPVTSPPPPPFGCPR